MPKSDNWIVWTAGIIATILIGVITFMGNIVNANDKINIQEHTMIRKEISMAQEGFNNKLEKIISDLAYIKAKINKQQ